MKSQNDNLLLGIFLILVACLSFATQDAISRSLVGKLFPAQVMFAQFVGLFLYAAIAAKIKGVKIFKVNSLYWQILRALVLGAEGALFFFAFKGLKLGDIHAIFSLTPILITLLAIFLLKERAAKSTWVAIIFAFVGVIIIVRPGIIEVSTYTILALCGVFLWAFYQILNRIIGNKDAIEISLLFICVGALLFAFMLCLFNFDKLVMPDNQTWLKIVFLMLISILSFNTQVLAYNYAPANILQPFNYTTFAWAVLLGYVFFKDLPDIYTIVGATIIILSGLFVFSKQF